MFCVFLLTGFLFLISDFTLAQDNAYLHMNFDKSKVIASVDSLNIMADEFFHSYEMGPAFIRKSKNSKERHLDYIINEKLLALDGYSRNLEETEDISSVINEFKYDLATEEFFIDSILLKVLVEETDIDDLITKKQTIIEIRWIYTSREKDIKNIFNTLVNGGSFDSLYLSQMTDSVSVDDRFMKTSIYQLENKNPLLANLISTLNVGEISPALHVMDGWYIINLVNIEKNILITESEYIRLKQEAVNAITKRKMDSLSDQYVLNMLKSNNPIIKKDAFKVILSYLGNFFLPPEKYNEWQLAKKMDEALLALGNDINDSVLVIMDSKKVSIKDFLNWYKNRSNYIKLDKNSYAGYAGSIEKLIWKMVRDRLLTDTAIGYGYDQSPNVMKQLSWWKDKIVGSAVRNEIVNSVQLEITETHRGPDENSSSDSEIMQELYQKRLLRKILALKQKYNIEINKNELNSIPVSAEYDPAAIEFYTIKNRGLIPRTPYPTINHEWVNWE
jgi:hypothetical protein